MSEISPLSGLWQVWSFISKKTKSHKKFSIRSGRQKCAIQCSFPFLLRLRCGSMALVIPSSLLFECSTCSSYSFTFVYLRHIPIVIMVNEYYSSRFIRVGKWTGEGTIFKKRTQLPSYLNVFVIENEDTQGIMCHFWSYEMAAFFSWGK